ncbi:Uncharacterised protein [Plesiomonas shigelloides]|nr:Uncharacterised protein [Plesiomonas shigelloides]
MRRENSMLLLEYIQFILYVVDLLSFRYTIYN